MSLSSASTMGAAVESVKLYRSLTLVTCVSGILISLYAYYVETNKTANENYTAMCDLSEHISCTKPFSSPYGKGFGLLRYFIAENSRLNQPNSIFGILFYVMQLLLDQKLTVSAARLQVAFSMVANIGSVYLAYILTFILHNFCIVCVTMYMLNALLLYCSLKKLFLLSRVQSKANDRKKLM